MLMIGCVILLFISCLCKALTCDHLKHLHYHRQAKQCMDCDVCIKGEGVIEFKEVRTKFIF